MYANSGGDSLLMVGVTDQDDDHDQGDSTACNQAVSDWPYNSGMDVCLLPGLSETIGRFSVGKRGTPGLVLGQITHALALSFMQPPIPNKLPIKTFHGTDLGGVGLRYQPFGSFCLNLVHKPRLTGYIWLWASGIPSGSVSSHQDVTLS